MNRVLAAEHEAAEALESCRLEAEKILESGRRQAREILEHAERVARDVHARTERLAAARAGQIRAQADGADDERAGSDPLLAAVQRLATRMTGVGDA